MDLGQGGAMAGKVDRQASSAAQMPELGTPLHHWRRSSETEPFRCLYCGIGYHEAPAMYGCPRETFQLSESVSISSKDTL